MTKIAAIIPARGSSKGVPGKNIKLLEDKPLIAYTIEDSLNSSLVNRTFVSTDSLEIKSVSERYGAEVIIRPNALASDKATSESVIKHSIKLLEEKEGYIPDIIVFLQCTSPLRRRTDVDEAIKTLLENDYDSVFSVFEKHYMIWRPTSGDFVSFNFDHKNRAMRRWPA